MKYLLTTLALAIGLSASAQCRHFTKKECLPLLENFKQNDNYHVAVLKPGEKEDLELTFFGDRLYRVLVCSDSALDVTWSMTKKDGTTYNSWAGKPIDFLPYKTQQVTIHLEVSKSLDASYAGCVTVMIGNIKM